MSAVRRALAAGGLLLAALALPGCPAGGFLLQIRPGESVPQAVRFIVEARRDGAPFTGAALRVQSLGRQEALAQLALDGQGHAMVGLPEGIAAGFPLLLSAGSGSETLFTLAAAPAPEPGASLPIVRLSAASTAAYALLAPRYLAIGLLAVSAEGRPVALGLVPPMLDTFEGLARRYDAEADPPGEWAARAARALTPGLGPDGYGALAPEALLALGGAAGAPDALAAGEALAELIRQHYRDTGSRPPGTLTAKTPVAREVFPEGGGGRSGAPPAPRGAGSGIAVTDGDFDPDPAGEGIGP